MTADADTKVDKTSEKQPDQNGMKESASDDPNKSGCCTLYIPKRIVMAILCTLGMVIVHSMRVNVGIVVITILDEQAHLKVGSSRARQTMPNVKWNSTLIGFLHSVFYVGFLITQIPGGYFSTRLPGHRIFGASILLSSALNLIIPVAIADLGYIPTCIIRFLQGLSEGVMVPALYTVMSRWYTSDTVSKYGGWIFGGMYAGPCIGFPLDGALTHYWSWEYVFYVHGGMGISWFLLWFMFAYEKPEAHPTINQDELKLITLNRKISSDNMAIKIPWKEMFFSLPVWAIIVCHFVRSWVFYLMLTNEPMYLNQFHFTILENGIFSSLPHILKVMMAFTSGYMADSLIRSNKLSKTNTRKIFTAIGFGVEAIACYVLVFVSRGHVAIGVLCVGIGISGLAVSGWQINHLDLAPDFASVLVGLSATVGTVGGIISPIVTGIITHPQTMKSWQNSFILTGSVVMCAVVVYSLFGSGELQSWAEQGESMSMTSKTEAPTLNKEGYEEIQDKTK